MDYWEFYTTRSEQQEGLAIQYRQSQSLSPMMSRVTLQDVGSSCCSKHFHNQKINKKKGFKYYSYVLEDEQLLITEYLVYLPVLLVSNTLLC